jgi:hypothetical protein
MSELLREDFAEMFGAMSRIAYRFQLGAVKYARMNWRHCENPQTYKESAMRHLAQYINGQTDEDHLGAAAANVLILLDLEEEGVKIKEKGDSNGETTERE